MPRINAGLAKSEQDRNKIEAEIVRLSVEKNKLAMHSRLLFAYDTPLEDVVTNAFSIVGLEYKLHSEEKTAEGIIRLEDTTELELAIVEVKGLDEKIKLRHLDHVNRWISDYMKKNMDIFIPNQYRIEPCGASKDKGTSLSIAK